MMLPNFLASVILLLALPPLSVSRSEYPRSKQQGAFFPLPKYCMHRFYSLGEKRINPRKEPSRIGKMRLKISWNMNNFQKLSQNFLNRISRTLLEGQFTHELVCQFSISRDNYGHRNCWAETDQRIHTTLCPVRERCPGMEHLRAHTRSFHRTKNIPAKTTGCPISPETKTKWHPGVKPRGLVGEALYDDGSSWASSVGLNPLNLISLLPDLRSQKLSLRARGERETFIGN